MVEGQKNFPKTFKIYSVTAAREIFFYTVEGFVQKWFCKMFGYRPILRNLMTRQFLQSPHTNGRLKLRTPRRFSELSGQTAATYATDRSKCQLEFSLLKT